MKFHKYADIFPMMNREELESLVEDIYKNGYDSTLPVILYQGEILDGRNRYTACQELGIEPVYVEFQGDDDEAFDYVIRTNLHRRHLTPGQTAIVMMAARERYPKIYAVDESGRFITGDKTGKNSQKEYADKIGVSTGTVAHVDYVATHAPELLEKIKQGAPAKTVYKEAKAQQKQQQKAELAAKAPDSLPDLVDLRLGDMRELGATLDNDSVDIIITDPPYPGEFIGLWSELAKLAARVLKPSGFLFAYSGQLYLPEVVTRLSEHLTYYWTLDMLHSGANQLVMPRNVFCAWKPIFVYQKSPFKKFEEPFQDTLQGAGREKGLHDWQQAETEIDVIIDRFTMPGDVVLDPFAGSGTTLAAAARLKRHAIGFELDKTSYALAKERLSHV